jgi:hypothetical protein
LRLLTTIGPGWQAEPVAYRAPRPDSVVIADVERYWLRWRQGLSQVDAPPAIAVIAVGSSNWRCRDVGQRRVVDVGCAIDQRGLQQGGAGVLINLEAALPGKSRLHVANLAALDLSPGKAEGAPVPDELEVGNVNLRPGDTGDSSRRRGGRRCAVQLDTVAVLVQDGTVKGAVTSSYGLPQPRQAIARTPLRPDINGRASCG